jgi:putative oxidoreductase
MLSGIFIVAGANHLFKPNAIAGRLDEAPLSFLATWAASPKALVLLAGIALLAGGLALLFGLRTRAAATLLIALIIPITLTVQVGRIATLGPLFKNIGLTGALIYFAVHGSQYYSLDNLLWTESN